MPKVREAFVLEDLSISSKVEEDYNEYLELSDRVGKVVPRLKDFGGTHFYLKSLFFFVVYQTAEAYLFLYKDFNPFVYLFLGFWVVFFSTTVGHEGHHGSVSLNPSVNALFRFGYNLMGESTIHWIQYHLVEHHLHVNNLQFDPEKASGMAPRAGAFSFGNILRINPMDKRKWRHLGQHVHFIIYGMFYALFNFFFNFTYAVTGHGIKKVSKALWRYRITGLLVNLQLMIRLFILPVYLTGTYWTLVNSSFAFLGYGLHQAFWAVIVHSFDGVLLSSNEVEKNDKRKSNFLYRQVASTSSCGGELAGMIAKLVNIRHDSFLFRVNATYFFFGDQPCNNKLTGWFTGGINYHIEHHLFPRMNHLHLPKIQPIVREFCSERGIPYNYFPSVWGNFLSFVKHLHFLGHNDKYDNMALSPLKPSKQGALDLVLSQHQVDQIYSYDKNR